MPKGFRGGAARRGACPGAGPVRGWCVRGGGEAMACRHRGRSGGRRVPRRGPALVTGVARLTEDLVSAGVVHVFVRSSWAHAQVVGVDTCAVAEAPGVVGGVPGRCTADLGRLPAGDRPEATRRPVLAADTVRFSPRRLRSSLLNRGGPSTERPGAGKVRDGYLSLTMGVRARRAVGLPTCRLAAICVERDREPWRCARAPRGVVLAR